MTAAPDFRIAVRANAIIGESPIWSSRSNRLLWIDILGGQIHNYDPVTGVDEVINVPGDVGLLAESPMSQIILGIDCELARLGADGRIERFARAPHADQAFRFNDGKYDRQGRLWTGLR